MLSAVKLVAPFITLFGTLTLIKWFGTLSNLKLFLPNFAASSRLVANSFPVSNPPGVVLNPLAAMSSSSALDTARYKVVLPLFAATSYHETPYLNNSCQLLFAQWVHVHPMPQPIFLNQCYRFQTPPSQQYNHLH